ncbi:hypothetical protein ACH5RR_010835 [Cinchona calisaya]|uniref:Uncharacterized protein n=1 Tax=Cinchona calisaya TaxID=153742 RepID=A0ABD3AK89_9GENT
MTMQSRLATKVNRLFVSGSLNQIIFPYRLSASISGGGRTADPAVHAVDPEEKNDASEAASSTNQSEFKLKINKDEDPYVPPKSPYSSSPKIQSTQQPQEPIKQQKRHSSSTSPCVTEPTKEEVNCAGLDGSPWPEDNQDRRSQRDEQEADDKGYFRHHKASPLSELEMADTRKPITRATDGTAGSYLGDYGSGVILWRPEQLDTAEDSLRRAMQIWKTNAMRGDPDSPHGRILRTLRGEYW